ncbi:ATP-binding protein [Agrilactobacillus fermenti]|uniref:ATP-binding protein n=1 Tax=Agrilactobacillus fermenti TaxID=2586909 RepID=UPI001E51B31A|nr:ATP-binding protein [Agrilactobacillus fermenti]MCD2255623.1 sensor histidine kinase [Agrilactobacillus fermenti]
MVETTITIEAKDELYKEVGNTSYDLIELLGELIDNAIGARTEAQLTGQEQLQIQIKISKVTVDQRTLTVTDNGAGISLQHLGDAVSLSGTSGGSGINEHGMGMKQAVAALGKLIYLRTKTAGAPAYEINTFRFGQVPVKELDTFEAADHLTEIAIADEHQMLELTPRKVTQAVVPFLGAKYRRYLTGSAPITISVALVDETKVTTKKWSVTPIVIHYFNPTTGKDEPILKSIPFQGAGWLAHLTFGYAPTKDQYTELNVPIPKMYEPYNVAVKKQGIDIIKDDRVINFTQLEQIGLVPKADKKYNLIRGELELDQGFPTSTTKNYIMRQEHWQAMIEQVKNYLDENYLLDPDQNDNIDGLPRESYKNQLSKYFQTRFQNVQLDASLSKLSGKVDIVTDNIAWLVVDKRATDTDVLRLFSYLMASNGRLSTGQVLSSNFAASSQEMVHLLRAKYGVDIRLQNTKDLEKPLQRFLASQPMTRMARYAQQKLHPDQAPDTQAKPAEQGKTTNNDSVSHDVVRF